MPKIKFERKYSKDKKEKKKEKSCAMCVNSIFTSMLKKIHLFYYFQQSRS